MAARKAFLFDMDGTLLDSMGCWENLADTYLRIRGLEPVEDIERVLGAMSMAESALWLKKNYELSEEPEHIISEILKMVEERYRVQAPLKPGVREFLEQCRMERIPMGVVTATPRRFAEPTLKRRGVLDYFRFVLDCEGFPGGKQHPQVYEHASGLLGATPRECVVFEDAAYAQATAWKAGYYVVGVEDASERMPVEERLSCCHRFVYSFSELSLKDGVLTGGKYGGQGGTETV